MRTHHGTADICVSDANDVEFYLCVSFSVSGGCAAHYDAWHGWSPPEGPELEISEVLCKSMRFHHGEATTMPIAAEFQKSLGSFCLEVFGDDIEEKCFEDANQAELAGREE